MRIINTAFKDAVFNDTFHIQALSDDFPIQTGAPVVNFIGLLNNVAASLGILGGIAGLGGGEAVELAGGIVGVFGGILGQVASNLEEDSEDPGSVEPALVKRMGSIFSAVTTSIARFMEAVFKHGDLKDFPGITLAGATDYEWSISAFFDNGNFFYGTEFTVGTAIDVEQKISERLLQLLTGVALTEANWYVLRNSYPPDQCPTDKTGRVIGGTCFTLERPGEGGKLGGADVRGEYSLQMDEETLEKVTSRNVVLEELYLSSNECQKKTKAYNVQGSMSVSSFQSTKIEPCFYNLPVLTVRLDNLEDIPHRASPCSVILANKTATKDKTDPVTGVTYLPPNLEPIFTTSGFCSVDNFVDGPGTD